MVRVDRGFDQTDQAVKVSAKADAFEPVNATEQVIDVVVFGDHGMKVVFYRQGQVVLPEH